MTTEKGGKRSDAQKALRELNGGPGRPGKTSTGAVLARAFRRLSDLAGPAFEKLEEAVNNEAHPQHTWAVQFVLERIATRKTFEAIAEAEFGNAAGSTTPRISIVINQPAQVETLQHTPREDAEAEVITYSPARSEHDQ